MKKSLRDLVRPPHDPRPRRPLAALAATVLASLGLLHVLWALGNPWPASDSEAFVATSSDRRVGCRCPVR
ncbi:hypothetical protein LC082_12975 [Microbacterium esteraromaticum]|uniref:hypothetical protein n=1 Tax=Microbacterium esteraromaticum TaxID=57043 RepID=UPI001CD4F514|nr:hypothetical protein [Microbacterium esteraromaticum]MCA1307809.1 hypothetical protein [Microbacterium esteraromaticum]